MESKFVSIKKKIKKMLLKVLTFYIINFNLALHLQFIGTP